ncbi:YceD family protein [Lentibacillus sediminis]|uniref:YceD family protein n=1 Tax=Lentibacillus sediminis TaxID=1940529 RepID=UPI000C1C05E7|nr:YceD family protein [Lentibacillus sediminis]
MKFALGQLRKDAYQTPFSFEDEVDVSELESMNNDIRKIKPVNVSGECYIQGEEIIFSLRIKGEMILPCARTLVDVPYSFDIRADEVFSTSPYYGEEDAEKEIHPVDGEVLDLLPYIKENILLEVPFRVFADNVNDPDAAPEKGQGWELLSEEDKRPQADPRLEKLQSLFDDNQEKK